MLIALELELNINIPCFICILAQSTERVKVEAIRAGHPFPLLINAREELIASVSITIQPSLQPVAESILIAGHICGHGTGHRLWPVTSTYSRVIEQAISTVENVGLQQWVND